MPPDPLHCRIVVAGDDVWEDLSNGIDQVKRLATDADMVAELECGLARVVGESTSPQVMVLFTAAGQFTPEQQRRVDASVRAGTGLVAIHCSAYFPGFNADDPRPDAAQYWSTAFHLLGVRYDSHGPQPHETTFTVHVDSDHPITRTVTDFPIHHEHYHVVMDDPAPQVVAWREADAAREPVMTAKQWGQGRVVWLQLGHDMRAFGCPEVRQLLTNALVWVAPRESQATSNAEAVNR
ncbi:MAG: ThuA domain-containing protein [Propionibacteriaceae bacterium]|jgi:type 1 glutamine amidotransferase|nr:ThuA domain-containing protein [Propionibacteriaceae bacterium]